ncbi:four helix bundle protein [Arachidicoccus ginsenosidimutans]|uniref:four helix bundle protein n=1 Tax=Arachidicoccus sp. BS20 TaxID=1850526 RepID=UPI0007F08F34|nr:four helix bundle protein [Arachidicoccus sp. BS20]ANI89563.1 four helix bundle protein [Arachidicoccus sp. BS20]
MRKELIENNPIVKHSIEFALLVIDYCEKLEANKKYVIARQLLKSGTSIGANIMEAQNPESKADFIHKIKIAAKETDETQYWLMLCDYAQSYPECKNLINKVDEISKIIAKIVSTSKKKLPISYLLSFFIF